MELKLFNNLTRQRETFKPQKSGEVKYYSCGPTTYNLIHVGNAYALVVGDLVFRVLKELGYKVTFVRNFTDVDDKIIASAKEAKMDALAFAEKYVQECLKDFKELNMLQPTHNPKVSETMPEIIKMIDVLVKKGFAYVHQGEVLYNVPMKKDYGKLSKKDLEGQTRGHRVEVEAHKKHPADFVLWKPAKIDEVSWDSPWGKGRPGWHIECSAMAKKFLGDTLDLHHGGVDLMFPHHENEIAQSEAANGCQFCNHWVHNEFLNFGHEKMSKSLGNVISVRAFCEKYHGLVLRHLLLSVHYRAKLDWSDEVINKSIHELSKIHEFLVDFKQRSLQASSTIELKASEVQELVVYKENILKELCQDFNSAAAIAQFFVFMRHCKQGFDDAKGNSKAWFTKAQEVIDLVSRTLGVLDSDPASFLHKLNLMKNQDNRAAVNSATIDALLLARAQAKKDKDFKKADAIRDEILALGLKIKDHSDGTSSWE